MTPPDALDTDTPANTDAPAKSSEIDPVTDPLAAGGDDCQHHHGYIQEKDRYKARLKRIEGQVRGIHRMIDEEQYCIDILTQVSAINSALRNVALGLLDDHMRHCVRDAVIEGDEAAEVKFKEVADAIARFAR